MRSSTPSRSSSLAAICRELVAERGERLLAPVDQHHPDRRRVEAPELALQAARRQLADLAGQLDTRRAGADDDDGEPALALGRRRRRSRPSRRRRRSAGAAPARRRWSSCPVRTGPARRARSTTGSPRRRRSGCRRGARGRRGAPALVAWTTRRSRSKPVTSASLDADVAVLPDHVADRRGDLARRQHAGRHLVEQRLEQVVVAPVDQRHVDRHVPEQPRGEEAAEAPADDHHAMALFASRCSLIAATHGYRPGLECMMPPSAKIVVAVR